MVLCFFGLVLRNFLGEGGVKFVHVFFVFLGIFF
jgi:hypothetical protein